VEQGNPDDAANSRTENAVLAQSALRFDSWKTYKLPKRKINVIATFFARRICNFQRYGNGSTRMAILVRMSGGDVP